MKLLARLSRYAAQRIALACLTGCLLGLPVTASQAAPRSLELYLLEAPPLSMSGPQGRGGILGDVSRRAAQLAGYELRFVSLPWLRAQRAVQPGENLLIIPLSRTPSREDNYTWIAPVMRMERAFFSLDKRVESFEQARATYRRVAVGMGSAQEQKLREEGFTSEQIYPLKIGENPAQMLLLGRVDAWFNGVPETRAIWRDVSSKPLLVSPSLMSADLYLACSKRCAKPLVDGLREAVETLHRDGTVQQIIDSYLNELPELDDGSGSP